LGLIPFQYLWPINIYPPNFSILQYYYFVKRQNNDITVQ
jgi:hypothetical protein